MKVIEAVLGKGEAGARGGLAAGAPGPVLVLLGGVRAQQRVSWGLPEHPEGSGLCSRLCPTRLRSPAPLPHCDVRTLLSSVRDFGKLLFIEDAGMLEGEMQEG